jgi:uncharacterized protein YqgV (UPF0045/DUF77 family)
MEFPITRERLQNFSVEYKELTITKLISLVVEDLTSRIINRAGMNNTHGPQICVLKVMIDDLSRHIRHVRGIYNLLDYMPRVISKLQERFPDIQIMLDPMKTYLYIDWS